MRTLARALVGLLAASGPALAQVVVDAGVDQALVFPNPVTLSAHVTGGTPLSYRTADGNGLLENYLVMYDDRVGVTNVGPLRLAAGGTFGSPTDLVRIGSTIYGIDSLRRMTYTLNPSTGIVTPLGSTAWPALYADVESLAYEGSRDRLLAVDRATGQLLEIRRPTGLVVPIGNRTLAAFTGIRSLAWRSAVGLLYAVDQATRRILSIDPLTGAPTVVCTMPAEPNRRIEELEFVGDRLYGMCAIDDGTNLVSAQLQRIFTTVGLAQNVGPVLPQVSATCLLIDSISEDRNWTKVSGPGTVTFSDAYALNPTVTFSKAGTYVLQLTVSTTGGPRSDTVTVTQNEWTSFTPSPDSRIIFVSSSAGNDANSGFSPSTPKRSVWAGRLLLRNGYPDWLLLKRGDVWDEAIGHWGLSGRSATEPMLVSTYGGAVARPLLRTGAQSGFNAWADQANSNVAIVGLHLWANTYNGTQGTPRGMQLFGAIQNFLIEDCCIQGFETNLVIQGSSEFPSPTGRMKNIQLRRNVILDAYTTGGTNSEGLYGEGVDGFVIVENVFDRNGWRYDVPGSTPTWFRRNIYLQNGNTGVVLHGNILAQTDGMQVRCGGVVEDNLLLQNAIAILIGGGTIPDPGGVTGLVRRNVILDGNDLGGSGARGWGMNFENVRQATVTANVVAHNVSGHGPYPVTFGVAGNGSGNRDILFSGNVIYAWNGTSRFTGDASQTVNIQVLNNRWQNNVTPEQLIRHDRSSSTLGVVSVNNTFYSLASPNAWMQAGNYLSLSQWKTLVRDTTSVAMPASFPDPSRTIASYHASIGGMPNLVSFMTEARKQSRANWRPQYTADAVNEYIRAGFGL